MTAGPAPARAADPVRTIFFGSGSFAVPMLDVVARHPRLNIVAVVTAPDRPAGRSKANTPTPVAVRARELDLPLHQPARLRAQASVAAIKAFAPDLGVLADYGQVVPGAVLDLPRHGILNIHPSLLPRHRGATPIPATILSGDIQAGVSIIRMDQGIDTGPIIASTAWPLDGLERASDLEQKAAAEGAVLLESTIPGWLDGLVSATKQAEAGATVTRPFAREDGRLDPTRSAQQLERQVRANDPWPGTFIETELGRVAVLAASIVEAVSGDESGRLEEHDGKLAITTADGRLVIEAARREGKRPAAGDEFLRGQRQLIGTRIR